MGYPVPHHLRGILVEAAVQPPEREVVGSIKCSCGSENLEFLYVADRVEKNGFPFLRVAKINDRFHLVLGAGCTACGQTHLLFDDKLHGWNGYVCGTDEERNLPRPSFQKWRCHKCTWPLQRITLTIQGEDKEFCLGEGEEVLTEADWFEGFGWLWLDLSCASCGAGPTRVVDYETM
jgi:hypothetical protein